ncbi:hypothetical protein GGI05_003012 [Coemansia sp. RSA 2603]|nr:hypothetical protein GGI05_003012 [Coemansia sp. RSA 2603]
MRSSPASAPPIPRSLCLPPGSTSLEPVRRRSDPSSPTVSPSKTYQRKRAHSPTRIRFFCSCWGTLAA